MLLTKGTKIQSIKQPNCKLDIYDRRDCELNIKNHLLEIPNKHKLLSYWSGLQSAWLTNTGFNKFFFRPTNQVNVQEIVDKIQTAKILLIQVAQMKNCS